MFIAEGGTIIVAQLNTIDENEILTHHYLPSEYELWAGDLNADGSIDILDIVIRASIILEIR